MASPSRRGPWGSSGPSGATLLEPAFQGAGSSHFQGIWFLGWARRPFPLCLVWQPLGLACFDPHLEFGLLWPVTGGGGAGRCFPQPWGHSSALCQAAAGAEERVQAPPGLRGSALKFEDIKRQIKIAPLYLHLGNPSWPGRRLYERLGLNYGHLHGDGE